MSAQTSLPRSCRWFLLLQYNSGYCSYIPVYISIKCVTLVTHPCYPNPCPSKDVCEINRETPENGNVNFVPYQCTPGNGCPFTDVI